MEFAPIEDVIQHIEGCISDDEICLTVFLDPDEIQGCKDDLAKNRTTLRALKSAPVAEQMAKDAARLQHLMDESGQWFIEVGYPAMMMGRLREAIDTAMGAQPEAPVAEPTPQALQELADQAQELDTWRCFFCDDVLTTTGSAAEHFGGEHHIAACQIKASELGLLGTIRNQDVELARYREEDSDKDRQMAGMRGEHNQALLREEEKGYARGVKDGIKYAHSDDYKLHAALQSRAIIAADRGTK